MENCIFCKIIKGEIPSVKLYEDDKCLVILDKFPASEGQSLVINKEHVEYIMDLEDDDYDHLFRVAKNIGGMIDDTLKPNRTCIVVEGFEVPHVHIKLFPCYEDKLKMHGDMAEDSELEEVRKKIKGNN